MATEQLQILLIEDNPDHAAMILRHVSRSAHGMMRAQHASTLAEGLQTLREGCWDAVLLDLQLPDSSGLDTLARLIENSPGFPVIVLTSLGDEELATKALQQGAQDYLVKDAFTTELLTRAVRYAIERKRIEERLRKSLAKVTGHASTLEHLNRRLQEQNRDLDEFNHMISHDLREPIRHLMVFGQRLQESAGDDLPAKAVDDLHHIQEAATRMQNSIAGLQLLSETSRREMNTSSVSLDACVRVALEEIEGTVEQKQPAITQDPLPEVAADAALLVLLLRQLLSNAMHFCDEKPRIHISAEQTAGQWIFAVHDNGIGIDPRYAERIFMAFRRLHGRGEYGGGSGLGLSICRKIVERHGGKLWVESEGSNGSIFRFTLAPETQDEYNSSQNEHRDPATILAD